MLAGIAQSLRPGFASWRGLEIFVYSPASRPANTYPAFYAMGICDRFLEGKAARSWSYTSTPFALQGQLNPFSHASCVFYSHFLLKARC